MIVKLLLLWLSLAKLSVEQLFLQFDFYDVVHVVFLGVLGVCLRIFDRNQRRATSKTVRSSLRSPASPGKNRGSVSFAAGTKFYPIQCYTPVCLLASYFMSNATSCDNVLAGIAIGVFIVESIDGRNRECIDRRF